MKSRAPQLHLEYRFYKQLGSGGKKQYNAFYCDESRINFWLKFSGFRGINLFNKMFLTT